MSEPIIPMIKKTVRVTIEKEIEIEMPESYGTPENIQAWCKSLWPIESVDDIFKHAAHMAAQHGGGNDHDGLGLLDEHYSTFPRVPDVKFKELYDDIETEIVED